MIDLHIEYTATKFGCDRWFDVRGTLDSWRSDIQKSKEDSFITPSEANTMFQQIQEIENQDPSQDSIHLLFWDQKELSKFFDGNPSTVIGISPSFQNFWSIIWVEFINHLKTEIKDNTKPECPECENPYPHIYTSGSAHCEECDHYWQPQF